MDRKPSERALELFTANYNCAQSVFAACATDADLNQTQRLAIAAAFGGGVARQGEICGALTGALMALGETRGDAVYAQAEKIITAFRAAHGSILCRELTGCRLNTEEGHRSFKERDVRNTVCARLVAFAADRVATARG